MKQIKLESLVKTDKSGTSEYGLWTIYDALADGEKYTWFRNTDLKGVVDPLPEVGASYIVTIKPNKNPKYQSSIKFEDRVEGSIALTPKQAEIAPKIAQSEGLVNKLDLILEDLRAIKKHMGIVSANTSLSEEPKVEDEVKVEDLPF